MQKGGGGIEGVQIACKFAYVINDRVGRWAPESHKLCAILNYLFLNVCDDMIHQIEVEY